MNGKAERAKETEREKEGRVGKGVLRNAPAGPAVGFISDLCVSSSLFSSYCVSRGVVVCGFLLSILNLDPFFILYVQTRVVWFFLWRRPFQSST